METTRKLFVCSLEGTVKENKCQLIYCILRHKRLRDHPFFYPFPENCFPYEKISS
jgi:hypothetical protein